MKQQYLNKKNAKKDNNEMYVKETSDFINYCKIQETKFIKYFPHLNVNERNAKLWEEFCIEVKNSKKS
jgi:hypothetical protein